MAQLTPWLDLMLEEIARKRDAQRLASEELARRATATPPATEPDVPPRMDSRPAKPARRARSA